MNYASLDDTKKTKKKNSLIGALLPHKGPELCSTLKKCSFPEWRLCVGTFQGNERDRYTQVPKE